MKVFIAGLPLEVDEAELTAVFGDFGPVKSLRIIKDRETKESKGFGFEWCKLLWPQDHCQRCRGQRSWF